MSVLLKRLAVAALIGPLGACTLTPVDLLIPAGVALVNHMSNTEDSGGLSVSNMLKRVRGEPETPEEIDGPVSVEEMLAHARGEEIEPSTVQNTGADGISVAELLAKARQEEPSQQPTEGQEDTPVTLADLRAQVLTRAPDAPDQQVCR